MTMTTFAPSTQPWELDLDQARVNANNWYRNDANKQSIYLFSVAVWCVLTSINLAVMNILWVSAAVGSWGYAGFVVLYFFPCLCGTTYVMLHSHRHAVITECRRLALTNVESI